MIIISNLKKIGSHILGLKKFDPECSANLVLSENPKSDVYFTYLHGYNVRLNNGNTYPLIVKKFTYFNAPLVELVFQASAYLKRPVNFLDVGAATGDTVLLINQRCNRMVDKYFCFEGDREFAELLRENMSQFRNVNIIETLLARDTRRVRSLIKHHLGTASCTGETTQEAHPLDFFIPKLPHTIDVLKIDVDGYDGEVLMGSKKILLEYKPWVIFEWHPMLLSRAGQDFSAPFEALSTSGYNTFIWYNNIGTFSHFSLNPSLEEISKMNDYLLAVNSRCDEHYDVIALPFSDSRIEKNLAVMDYSRRKAVELPVF